MDRLPARLLRLLTRDPTDGSELIVTRLEGVNSGVVIEGAFSLGWIARLTPEQLDFAGRFLANRGNVQKLAAEMGVSYNTARNRLDDIVVALGAAPEGEEAVDPETRRDALDRLAAGEINYEEALRILRGEEE